MADISLTKAKRIISATFTKGKEAGLKPLSVAVLDSGGNLVAFERQDGASPGRFQIAFGKAFGCVMLGMTGTQIRDRAEQQAYFVNAVNGAFEGKMVPVPGGILVKDSRGRVVGSVGVTGDTSENDAMAGSAGIEAANLVADA
ncbi:MAG: heme-binding protein [Pseudomonadota bacterium]